MHAVHGDSLVGGGARDPAAQRRGTNERRGPGMGDAITMRPIGGTVCRRLGGDGLSLRVRGLDAIDGTPVLDLKPVMTGFCRVASCASPAGRRH